jgi:hypothetical protein
MVSYLDGLVKRIKKSGDSTSGMPGWSASPGRRAKHFRSLSAMETSLILASRRRITPCCYLHISLTAGPLAGIVVPLVRKAPDPVVGICPKPSEPDGHSNGLCTPPPAWGIRALRRRSARQASPCGSARRLDRPDGILCNPPPARASAGARLLAGRQATRAAGTPGAHGRWCRHSHSADMSAGGVRRPHATTCQIIRFSGLQGVKGEWSRQCSACLRAVDRPACLHVTSLMSSSYGYDSGKSGPTRCPVTATWRQTGMLSATQNTSIGSMLNLRPCGNVKAGVNCWPRGFSLKNQTASGQHHVMIPALPSG